MRPSIPIQNIYYLYLYAWNRFPEGKELFTGAEGSPDFPNLLCRVLINGVNKLFRRGLDRQYVSVEEDITTVRGKIVIQESLKYRSRNARRIYCSFDELSPDVIHNQILKSALRRLFNTGRLQGSLSFECRAQLKKMSSIADTAITLDSFSRVKLHRNNACYDLLLNIAKLVLTNSMPKVGSNISKFLEFSDDEKEMARVFEHFIRNFYREEQREYNVKSLAIPWDAAPVKEESGGRLPVMRTDVFLQSKERELIIEAKYYKEAMQTYRGNISFRSQHLYQLFSYLKNRSALISPAVRLDGILLYPQVGSQIGTGYEIQGHEVKVCSIDLAQDWTEIHSDLIQLLATSP